MTRDKGRPDPSGDEAAKLDPELAAAADAETRVFDEEETAALENRIAESDAEAATVLAEEDDRTQLVARSEPESAPRSSDEPNATRVIDPASSPTAKTGNESVEAETRVLSVDEDKTSPPAVAATPAAGETPAETLPDPPPQPPIDSSKGLPPGMILFGEYEIVNVLGVGGMGEVYRARHRRLDEHRAIKVMHADLSKKKGASEFFYREAKALLAVRHPAVVHCHDLLSDDAGRVYLIMEMIEGIPLSKKMNDGPLSPDDVAILGARVAHGLSAAHRKGVIHRDVSPDNIVLPNGRVQEAKIIDFGIAKILQDGEGTIVDGFKGKLSYASPEQLGFFGGKIDGRSDFYSLGLVLVAAALGRPLGMGTTVMEAVDARRGFDVLPDEIPIGLRSAIQPLLALDPKDRPKYVDRLFVVPGGLEGSTDPGRYADSHARPEKANSQSLSPARVGLFAGIAAAAALLVGGLLYFVAGRETPAMVSPVAEATGEPVVREEPAAPVAEIEEPAPTAVEPVAAVVANVAPPKPNVRRLSGSDRLKIIGLLNNAKLDLDANQLMSPASDNAYDKYRQVLALDPNNQKAKTGLRNVAGRYVSLSGSAVSSGNLEQARTYLDRAKKADASHPGIAAAEANLTR